MTIEGTFSWGKPGVPLLPQCLREHWASDIVPEFVAKELCLEIHSTYISLDINVWKEDMNEISNNLRSHILSLLSKQRKSIEILPAFYLIWPDELNPRDLPLLYRTKNCLEKSGFIDKAGIFNQILLKDLFRIKSMGVLSVLDFLCVSEAVIVNMNYRSGSKHDIIKLESIINKLWSRQIGGVDPRFYTLRLLGNKTLYNILNSIKDKSISTLDYNIALNAINDMPNVVRVMSSIEAMSLEESLKNFLSSISAYDKVRLDAIANRLGWAGNKPITLAEAGSQIQVTRERFRQLEAKIVKRLLLIPYPVFMPALDRALEILYNNSPLGIEQASNLLREKKICNCFFHTKSLIQTAILLKRKPSISTIMIRGHYIVVPKAISNTANIIVSIAQRQTYASGITNITEVLTEAFEKEINVNHKTIKKLIILYPDFEFLDNEWFTIFSKKQHKNRLRNTSRRILSISPIINLKTLREGLQRYYRFATYGGRRTWPLVVPPRYVLRQFFIRHPEFLIDDDDIVQHTKKLDYRKELSTTEQALVNTLKSSPCGILDRASCQRECMKMNIKENTCSIYLSSSPIIQHYGVDIWGLRGTKISPGAMEAVRAANSLRARERRVLNYGWTKSGSLWMSAKLPEFRQSLVLGVPSKIKRYVSGKTYLATDEAGKSCGNIYVNDNGSVYGFANYLRRKGADKGDIMIIKYDIVNNIVTLSVVSEEMSIEQNIDP